MKYTIIALFTLSLIFAGCSDEWLNDVEPQGQLLETNYYQTDEEISTGIISIYSMWKTHYWDGWSSWYLMSSFASDDAVKHGDGPSDQPGFYASQIYTTTSTTPEMLKLWKRIYYGIYRANVVISRTNAETEFGQQAIGEAKMLRAIFYFDLIRLFGSGPLILEVLTPDLFYNQVKAPQADIFNSILEDLQAAADILPTRWTGTDGYRMTKYGALAYMSKVNLYMASPYFNMGDENARYAEAERLANEVITKGGYQLEEDFDDVWWYANQFNKESIIEISYTAVPGDGWADGSTNPGNIMGQLCGPRGIGGTVDTLRDGWGFDMIVPELVELYESEGDAVRLDATVLSEETIFSFGATAIDKKQDYTGYYSKKRTTWRAANPLGTAWGFSNNERVLRLGEIYLILAEAQIGQGKNGDAALNIVRDRVSLPAKTNATLEDIQLERRLELAMENNRFFDLVRWDIALEVLGPDKPDFHKGNYKERNAVWPIPQEEIDKSFGNIVQNPGY